jgi:hypothetical protein
MKMNKNRSVRIFLLIIIFSLFFSYFFVFGYSNEVGNLNGLRVNHIYRISMLPDEDIPTSFKFTKRSSDIYHVTWRYGGSIQQTGSWDVNSSTSVVSNMDNFGPDNGYHNFAWIWTNVSLDDQILMFNFFSNTDHLFNITGEAMHGTMDCWILEDDYGSEVWYEKLRGILINGTFKYNSDWQKFTFVSAAVDGIPGYDYFLLFGAIIGFGLILIRYRLREKKSHNKYNH